VTDLSYIRSTQSWVSVGCRVRRAEGAGHKSGGGCDGRAEPGRHRRHDPATATSTATNSTTHISAVPTGPIGWEGLEKAVGSTVEPPSWPHGSAGDDMACPPKKAAACAVTGWASFTAETMDVGEPADAAGMTDIPSVHGGVNRVSKPAAARTTRSRTRNPRAADEWWSALTTAATIRDRLASYYLASWRSPVGGDGPPDIARQRGELCRHRALPWLALDRNLSAVLLGEHAEGGATRAVAMNLLHSEARAREAPPLASRRALPWARLRGGCGDEHRPDGDQAGHHEGDEAPCRGPTRLPPEREQQLPTHGVGRDTAHEQSSGHG